MQPCPSVTVKDGCKATNVFILQTGKCLSLLGCTKGLVCFISPRRSGVMRPCYLFALSAFSLSSFSFFFCHGNLKFMPMPHASLPSFRCTSPVQVKCQQVTYCTDYHSASATCVQHACHLPCEDKWNENTS